MQALTIGHGNSGAIARNGTRAVALGDQNPGSAASRPKSHATPSAGHAEQFRPPPLASALARHGLQDAMPGATATSPGAQLAHVPGVAAPSVASPAGQGTHCDRSALGTKPGSHDEQDFMPEATATFPTVQKAHTLSVSGAWPGSHGTHAVFVALGGDPAAQL